jgi:LysR family hca operon transcriptional activator
MQGEPPTIELMVDYNKSNTSPVLKRFLSRTDKLASRVSQNMIHLKAEARAWPLGP